MIVETVTIIQATAGADLLEAGMKAGTPFYLAWDQAVRRFYVVQWERVHWRCSCGQGACIHQRAANTYLLSRQQGVEQELLSPASLSRERAGERRKASHVCFSRRKSDWK